MTPALERSTIAAPVQPAERIQSLDVLRGLALLGMLLVHFHDHSGEGIGWTAGVKWAVEAFVSERFFALFAFLFGVGFAIQLRRAEARAVAFVPLYLRRLAGLALFGFAAHALLGFNVLLGYAIFAVPLLLLHRWSTRALLVVALVFTLGWAVYRAGIGAYEWATLGAEGANQAHAARVEGFGERWSALDEARAQDSYLVLLEERLRHIGWFYRQGWMLIPNELPLFIFGLLALRCGIFDETRRRTRLIATTMAIGLVAWAASIWLLPLIPEFGPPSVVNPLRYSSRLGQWLMFTYAGGILLLLTYRPRWQTYVAPFAWAGRMALTNYFVQILTVDLLVSGYAVGVGELPPELILPATLTLFSAQAVFSRLWLGRYRFGPLEWLWRSMTYGRWQPLRRSTVQRATALAG